MYDCTIIGERLYAVGAAYSANDSNWVIAVLDLNLGLLNYVNLTETSGAAITTISDSEFLYIAGIGTAEFNLGLRIKKMRLSDLSMVKEYVSNLSNVSYAYDISINPVSNQIWVVGNIDSEKWRIEILDKDLMQIKSVETDIGSSATSICFDKEGYSYVAGDGGVVKLNRDGEEVKRYIQPVLFVKTLFLNNRLYAASGEYIGNYSRQVLYVFDRELNLLNKTVISSGMDTDTMFLMGKMVSDGENIYAAGFAYLGYYDYEWVVYSIKVGSPPTPWYLKYWYTILILILVALIVPMAFLLRRKRGKPQQPPQETQPSRTEEGEQPEAMRSIG
ncbi:MAG: hypothetical protein ACUVUS_01800 [Thermoproteota archaeon]